MKKLQYSRLHILLYHLPKKRASTLHLHAWQKFWKHHTMNVLVWNELDMMLESLEVHKMMFSLLMNVFTASLLSIFCDRRPLRLGVPNPIVARYEYNLSLRCTFWKSNIIYHKKNINFKLNHINLCIVEKIVSYFIFVLTKCLAKWSDLENRFSQMVHLRKENELFMSISTIVLFVALNFLRIGI